jgi:transcriptional regulator with XRE-family HTH domain
MMNRCFAERVKAWRIARGFTQEELAKRVGVSKVAISQVECGYSKSMHPENLFRLADALQADARELVFGKSNCR